MAGCQLRVYHGPSESSEVLEDRKQNKDSVTLPLEEVLPLLADAQSSQRTWLTDFCDDEITISTDLYEVLLAYRHYRRPSA